LVDGSGDFFSKIAMRRIALRGVTRL